MNKKKRNRESRVSGSALSKARLRQWIVLPSRKGEVWVQFPGRASFVNSWGQCWRTGSAYHPTPVGSIPAGSNYLMSNFGNPAPVKEIGASANRSLCRPQNATVISEFFPDLSRRNFRLACKDLERQTSRERLINQKAGYHLVSACRR